MAIIGVAGLLMSACGGFFILAGIFSGGVGHDTGDAARYARAGEVMIVMSLVAGIAMVAAAWAYFRNVTWDEKEQTDSKAPTVILRGESTQQSDRDGSGTP
jgi:hypothetical protein